MSTLSALTGQSLVAQTRPNPGDRSGGSIGGQPPSAVRRQVEDQVTLSAGNPQAPGQEVSGSQAAAGIGGNVAAAAQAHQVPAELMAILDELDSLGV